MSLDPRTPVLVGCGQVTQRAEDPALAAEPLALMTLAAERAADDAGSRDLLAAVDSIRVPRGLWRYSNPGALLAERFGADHPETGLGPISGNTVQVMLSRAAAEIAAGRRDVVLLVGGECEHSKRRARAAGAELAWTEQTGSLPDETFGSHDPGFGWWEATWCVRPVQAFSLYENAIRHRRGESPSDHRVRIAALWARFADVASRNPYAWIKTAPDAETIATPSADNRMLAYPYTKRLVSNMVVDQGAALLLTSLEAARRHGVPEDRLVFPHAATDIGKSSGMPERHAYHEGVGMRIAGQRALALAGAGAEDMAHVDLYSCFPSAVQMAAEAVGLDLERELTVTGGLTFSGGPFNSYVMHAIATMMERLRAEPGTRGYVSSVGGYLTKHAAAVYGTAPPEGGFRHENLDAVSLAEPVREAHREFDGPVTVETFAVMPGAGDESPDFLLAACLTAEGGRAWARNDDPALLASLDREELCGRYGEIRDGVLELD